MTEGVFVPLDRIAHINIALSCCGIIILLYNRENTEKLKDVAELTARTGKKTKELSYTQPSQAGEFTYDFNTNSPYSF